MPDFKTYMSLTDADLAAEYATILEDNKVPFKLQDTSKDFDASFSNNKATQTFMLMLDPKHFERADTVLESKTPFDINEIEPNHPLFSFTNAELSDVVINYDEWNPLDVKLAKYLLKQNNIEIDKSEIQSHQKEKEIIKNTEQNDSKSNTVMILSGYVFCLLGGLIGILIGVFLITAKSTLSDGTKIYFYKKSEREHGYLMLIAGFLFVLLYLYLKLK